MAQRAHEHAACAHRRPRRGLAGPHTCVLYSASLDCDCASTLLPRALHTPQSPSASPSTTATSASASAVLASWRAAFTSSAACSSISPSSARYCSSISCSCTQMASTPGIASTGTGFSPPLGVRPADGEKRPPAEKRPASDPRRSRCGVAGPAAAISFLKRPVAMARSAGFGARRPRFTTKLVRYCSSCIFFPLFFGSFLHRVQSGGSSLMAGPGRGHTMVCLRMLRG